jgi:hypothetical protein
MRIAKLWGSLSGLDAKNAPRLQKSSGAPGDLARNGGDRLAYTRLSGVVAIIAQVTSVWNTAVSPVLVT